MFGDETGRPQGREIYDDYAALWHLESIGVLGLLRDGPRPCKGRKSRVALIDTSVAVDHPCLATAIDRDLAIDFFSNRLGAFPCHPGDHRLRLDPPNLATSVADDLPETRALLGELVDRLSPGAVAHVNGVAPATSPDFSNHGTAIAGLVGARPALVEIAAEYRGAGAQALSVPLPYAGVDPFCELVPISTSFDTDPEMLILAFLYAEIIGADVVLLPRSIPDPGRLVPELAGVDLEGEDLGTLATQVEIPPRERALWDELARLIVAVSMRRPVVCAAGNSQESGGIYPANLASEHNGVIAVGAANAKGMVAGYSQAAGATVLAPGNDVETFDRVSVRLDEQQARFADRLCPPRNDNRKFSHFEIVTTDVPGRHGYSYSPYASDEPAEGLREFGSYFCRFGGSSAASAIVAGFVSLGRSLGEIDDCADGPAARNWLLSRCVPITTDEGSFLYPSWTGKVSFPDLYGL